MTENKNSLPCNNVNLSRLCTSETLAAGVQRNCMIQMSPTDEEKDAVEFRPQSCKNLRQQRLVQVQNFQYGLLSQNHTSKARPSC